MQSVDGRYCRSAAIKSVQSNLTEGHRQQNFPEKEVALKCSADSAKIHGGFAPDCMNQSHWIIKWERNWLECSGISPENVFVFKHFVNFFFHLYWRWKTVDLIILFGMRCTCNQYNNNTMHINFNKTSKCYIKLNWMYKIAKFPWYRHVITQDLINGNMLNNYYPKKRKSSNFIWNALPWFLTAICWRVASS